MPPVLLFRRSVTFNSVATSWTVARQAPLSMGILQARILGWVAMPSSRDLPEPGMEPVSPELAGRFFTTKLPRKPIPILQRGKRRQRDD